MYLGISALEHDASVSLIDSNGDILYAGHSERYTGKKNDKDLNEAQFHEVLKYGNFSEIAWYERPLLRHARQVCTGEKAVISRFPRIRNELSKFGIDSNLKLKYWNHHNTHGAAGFQTSEYENAIVIVIDGIGEFDTCSIWYAEYKKGFAKYKKLFQKKYPNSIGLYYSAVTDHIGLKANEEEYIMMGMAAYGNPFNGPECDRIASFMKTSREDFHCTENLHIGVPGPKANRSRREDIAARAQIVTEQCIHAIFQRAQAFKKQYNTKNTVYTGGVALNCKANTGLIEAFGPMWIMPNPGDAGSSLGAACLSYGKKVNFQDCYLGTDIPGLYPVQELLRELSRTGIAGVANGRAEFGPRAFGNRSLLADPRGVDIKDRVNSIKQRQKFRPFAPVVLEEHANEYFEMPIQKTPYMQYTVKCKRPGEFPAIVHADSTSRVQTVGKDCRSGIRQLLEQWYRSTGCPMLLNTSLNIRGKPMVNTRADADLFEQEYGVRVFSKSSRERS